jgi:hypothetical protein
MLSTRREVLKVAVNREGKYNNNNNNNAGSAQFPKIYKQFPNSGRLKNEIN